MSSRGRGRPRKVGQGRKDAALDAMRFMGFPRDVILKAIKNLLKAYEGDEGWPFIEEHSYTLLIETILENQEHCEDELNLLEQEENVGAHSEQFSSPQRPPQIIARCTNDEIPKAESLEIEVHSMLVESTQEIHHSETPYPAPFKRKTSYANTSQVKLEQQTPSPTTHACVPIKKKPCYGWLSSDEEEDDIPISVPAA